jgi:hypothetical protein
METLSKECHCVHCMTVMKLYVVYLRETDNICIWDVLCQWQRENNLLQMQTVIVTHIKYCLYNFHSRTMRLGIIKVFTPTDEQVF